MWGFFFINRCPLLPFLPSIFLHTNSPLLQLSTCLNPSFVTPDYTNYWKSSPSSLAHRFNLLLSHKTWACFAFACFNHAHFIVILTPSGSHSLCLQPKEKAKRKKAAILLCYLLIFAFLRPKTFSCIAQGRQLMPIFFVLSSSISHNNLPAAPPCKLFLLQTHGFCEVCADLC